MDQSIAALCTWSQSNLLAFWIPVVTAFVGGALGGLAEHGTHFRLADGRVVYDSMPIDESATRELRNLSVLIGAAGGLGFLFLFVATRWWADEQSVSHSQSMPLFVLTVSVISGFGAKRLLPKLVQRLETKVDEAMRLAVKAESEAGEAKTTSVEAARLAEATAAKTRRVQHTAQALATLGDPNAPATEVFTSIQRLREAEEADPLDRSTTIILGRLLVRANDVRGAILTLTNFIQLKESSGGASDRHVAAALYNRGCYRDRLRKEPTLEKSIAEKLRIEALEDFKKSFAIDPLNKDDALTDPDLLDLRGDPDFLALLA